MLRNSKGGMGSTMWLLWPAFEGVFVPVFDTTFYKDGANFPWVCWAAHQCSTKSTKRLMSPFSVCNATTLNPFLLSLNALLVVTGFCHVFPKYCQDKLLLGLQQVAKENKMGPIWCGVSRNFVHGCNSKNNSDFILKHFTLEATCNMAWEANYQTAVF